MNVPFEGVLAVVGRRFPDRLLQVGAPHEEVCSPLPLACLWRGEAAGSVSRVWRDGDLVRYEGQLHDGSEAPPELREGQADHASVLPWEAERAAALRGDIARGEVIGLPDMTGASMGHRGGVTVLDGWRVRAVTLLSARARPWPEVELRLADG